MADGYNTDTFALEANFPMWRIDDVGYSLQTLYNSACSACVQEDVYDENTNEYIYSRDVNPPEVDYWYNPFKAYRYNYPYMKDQTLWQGYNNPCEKRTAIWSDGFDKLNSGEKPNRNRRFNLGKQFLCYYSPKNERLIYQLNYETSRWQYNETYGAPIPPNLNACLTTDYVTYRYDKTHKSLGVRFFENKNGSLIEYLYNNLPIVEDRFNSARFPIRFYDNVTGDLYYIVGTVNDDGRIAGVEYEMTSFNNLKLILAKYKKEFPNVAVKCEFHLEGIYKANNYDRPLKDVCINRFVSDLNDIGSWSEIINKLIADNNLDTRFIMDSRIVCCFIKLDKDNNKTTIGGSTYQIVDSVFVAVTNTDDKTKTNLPVDDPDAMEEIFSHGIRVITEDVVYSPSFVINEKLSVGFPVQLCYTTDPNGIRSCEIENYGWNEKRQGIEFDVVLRSTMINDSISLSLATNQLKIDGWTEGQLNPPNRNGYRGPNGGSWGGNVYVPLRFHDFADDFALGHPNTVSGTTWDYLGMCKNAVEAYTTNSAVDYGKIVLTTSACNRYNPNEFFYFSNSIPMQANGQIKFIVARTYHCFVPTTVLNDELIITGDFINTPIKKRVSFAKYSADVYYEKLTNNVDVELPGGVILKAYMYDATKICIKDDLGTSFNLDKAMIYITEVLPNGKSCEFALNETPDDFVFVEPFQYNSDTGYDEVIIYISAKNSEGYGFNDATVNFSFELPEEIRNMYNLKDTSWNIGYRSHLPPFIIQGVPSKVTAEAVDPVIPANYSRVDFPAAPYQASRLGWKTNYLFTNADPLYHVVASGFVPEQLEGFEFSNVSSYIHDDSTGMNTYLDYTYQSSSKTIPTLISGHNEFASSSSETTYEGNFTVWEYDQLIKSNSLKTRKTWTKNAVTISGRCDYDAIVAANALTTHVVKIKEETSDGFTVEGDKTHSTAHKVIKQNDTITIVDA